MNSTGITAPVDGDVLASGRASKGWSEFDVTDFVASQTDDEASFSLSMQSTSLPYLGFNSREGGNPPDAGCNSQRQ